APRENDGGAHGPGGEGSRHLGREESPAGVPDVLVQGGQLADGRDGLLAPDRSVRPRVRIRGAVEGGPLDDRLQAWRRRTLVGVLRGPPAERARGTHERRGDPHGEDGRPGHRALRARVSRTYRPGLPFFPGDLAGGGVPDGRGTACPTLS